jgi:hypothetical protein
MQVPPASVKHHPPSGPQTLFRTLPIYNTPPAVLCSYRCSSLGSQSPLLLTTCRWWMSLCLGVPSPRRGVLADLSCIPLDLPLCPSVPRCCWVPISPHPHLRSSETGAPCHSSPGFQDRVRCLALSQGTIKRSGYAALGLCPWKSQEQSGPSPGIPEFPGTDRSHRLHVAEDKLWQKAGGAVKSGLF